MKKLYLASCPETDFDIVVYSSDTKEARNLIKKNLDEEYLNFIELNSTNEGFNREQFVKKTKNKITDYFNNNKFKLSRIDRLKQLPELWKNAYPWSDIDIGLDYNCREILFINKEKLKKEKKIKMNKKILFIEEQADRLDKILQKKGVDALFLYSLIDHGLDEEIINCWKKKYLFKFLNKFKYFYCNDKGKLQGNTVYIDDSKYTSNIIWCLGDFDIDDCNRYIISKIMEKVCFLFDNEEDFNKNDRICYINGYNINIVKKPIPSVENIKKYTLAGIEYVFYKRFK